MEYQFFIKSVGKDRTFGKNITQKIEFTVLGNYNIYWTNIDKLHLISKGKTERLEEECEKVLNNKYSNDKSIFEMEIEIIKPAVIIFLTGPDYYKTMGYALGTSFDDKPMLTKNQSKPIVKNQSKPIVNITDKLKKYSYVESAFWTYHPKYLNMNNEIHNVIDHIKINIDTKE